MGTAIATEVAPKRTSKSLYGIDTSPFGTFVFEEIGVVTGCVVTLTKPQPYPYTPTPIPLYPYTPTPTPTPYPYPYGTPTGAWSSRRCVHSKALLLVKRWQ